VAVETLGAVDLRARRREGGGALGDVEAVTALPHPTPRELSQQNAIAAADLDDRLRRSWQFADQLDDVVALARGAELAPGSVAEGVVALR
jgi:hypothetical protein